MSKKVIAFHYKLTDVNGNTIDQSEANDPLAFMTGVGQIITGLENVLVTLDKGERRRVEVEAQDAYGERDLSRILTVNRNQLPEGEIKIGDVFQSPTGEAVTVTAVTLSEVTLDTNHPLAGQKLIFDVEIASIREATLEELAHGHAHGADGSHHH